MARTVAAFRRAHSRTLLLAVITLAFASRLPARARADCSPPGGVHVNQVRYFDRALPDDGRANPLVEIYNKGAAPATLGGYVLTVADGAIKTTLPSWTIPAGAFLEVVFATGPSDMDFSDGVGTYYTNGDSVAVFDHGADGIALYDAPGGNIIDYVSWSSTGSPPSGSANSDAVTAGLWPSGEAVTTDPLETLQALRLVPDGYDNNVPADWDHLGWSESRYGASVPGPNAIQISPQDGTAIPSGEAHFEWSDVASAVSYRLVVASDPGFASLEKDTTVLVTSADLFLTGPGHYWKVEPIDGCGPIASTVTFSFIDASLLPPAPGLRPGGPKQPLDLRVLGVNREFQHKDSGLLCLYDSGTNGAGVPNRLRPGCTEATGDAGPWDKAHPTTHASFDRVVFQGLRPRIVRVGCPHCHNYCARASVAMLNHFYGGDLTQDRISYQYSFSGGWPATHPEEDLGHDAPATRAATTITLPWALTNSQIVGNNQFVAPTYAQIKARVVAGFPIMAGVQGHVFIVDGYCDANTFGRFPAANMIHVLDPWPTGMTPWQSFANVPFTGYWHIAQAGAAAIAGRRQEASVTTDSDGDGVVDFDEGGQTRPADRPRLLQGESNMTDTDRDEVIDKQEIRASTFHRLDHPAHNAAQVNAFNFADLDGDGLRAEADCDADGDGDFDGGEDISGNGINPEAGETDMFDAVSRSISLTTDRPIYIPTDNVILSGGTYHANSTYTYFIFRTPIFQCSFSIAINTPYAGFIASGILATDATGNAFPVDLGALQDGCYFVYLDIGHDGKFGNIVRGPPDVPENCDLTTAFIVYSVPTATEVNGPFLEPVEGGVHVRWWLSPSAGAREVEVERASREAGPWTHVITVQAVAGGTQALDDLSLDDPGDYFYRLRVALSEGSRIFGPAMVTVVPHPLRISTLANPNHGTARFSVGMPRSGLIGLRIYDGQGRLMRHVIEIWSHMGEAQFTWDGRGDDGALLASGTYFARVTAAARSVASKFVFLR